MKHLLLTTIAAVVLVGCGSVFVVHASGQNERSKAKAENVHMASSTLMATIEKDINYIYFILFIILTLIALAIYVIYKLDNGRPLREAAEKGNIVAVKQHIAAGVNVNAKDGFSRVTPLYLAAHNGHKEIVELLITKGADVNAPLGDGLTPLDGVIIWLGGNMPNSPSFRNQTETADLLRKHGDKTCTELKAEGK